MQSDKVEADILAYYAQGMEQSRLLSGVGQLEFLRTQHLLSRYLPQAPVRVLDVGGGAGVHALPLAKHGYEVSLIDPVPLHVEQAQQASLRNAEVGDARALRWPEASFDAVLLLGPLYHLPKQSDRLTALREAWRVLRPGGVVFAAAISRFASTLDGLREGWFCESGYVQSLDQTLREGERQNPAAYTHRPEELQHEVEAAGFGIEALVAVEGPSGMMSDLDEHLADSTRRDKLLAVLQKIEGETSLLGASPHVIVIGRKHYINNGKTPDP
jgi:ubiquinone/menaquinone biosynthesis C-methylase UbiE